ncbi:MAG: primosomal protein N', partial [Prochlorococcaceae cyanobacterium ETNP1_MAG_8]|nr:primosomal protein N' [Prochlorococcaceae cyanobacterium ETNP1_MAG_8]
MPASPDSDPDPATSFSDISAQVDVWLEAGRDGRCFTYVDSRQLGVHLGDLVVVRLRGRRMQGLVMDRRIPSPVDGGDVVFGTLKPQRRLQAVEALVQPAAVDPLWFEWVKAMAVHCHMSPFRMLKAALPPGWLGQRKSKQSEPRQLWWIQLEASATTPSDLPHRQADLQVALAAVGGGAWQRDLQADGFGAGLVNGLIKRGLIRREKRLPLDAAIKLRSLETCYQDLEVPQSLTAEQKQVMQVFCSQPPGTGMLLWGVTGSGKTEVYLQLVAREIEAGRHCLILTPEIGLIPQLVDRFRRRFGSQVFEYHSGCSDRERVSTWRQGLTAAEPLVVVGTRSAVFLPLSPLGLIVLDEEHDSSYKQESPMPCYHARDMAMERAKRTGARVVLGSATPSLVTWKNLAPKGSLALARLTRRISNQPLPPVHVVDMRQELADGHRRLISRPLMDRLSALPEAGEQAVVLVPRRGYSSFLSCRSCGEVVQC